MTEPILEARELSFGYTSEKLTLDRVNLVIPQGASVGIVGESGSGKSTLLRLFLGLLKPTSGDIQLSGVTFLHSKHEMKQLRRKMQVVFQDPYSSLDPRQRIDRLISEPLISLGIQEPGANSKKWRQDRVAAALESVGMTASSLIKYPGEFSGGQRQRIAIARALVCNPQILLADEPVSALDVSTRVRIIELLRDIRRNSGITILTVSHDLAVVASLCESIVVLKAGVIVEQGQTEATLRAPKHEYTQNLIKSLPRLPR